MPSIRSTSVLFFALACCTASSAQPIEATSAGAATPPPAVEPALSVPADAMTRGRVLLPRNVKLIIEFSQVASA